MLQKVQDILSTDLNENTSLKSIPPKSKVQINYGFGRMHEIGSTSLTKSNFSTQF